MIVRALGLETAAGYLATPTVFPDVTEAQSWAYGYINVAVTRGVIKGYPDGTFRPQGPVTQAEALTMVMRALGYKDSLPGDWPLDYIIAGSADTVGLVEAGFTPNLSATRAFVAEMVAGLLECELVAEIKDYPGEFEGTEKFFGVEKLGVDVDGWSGMVTAVSTTNKNITIAGEARKYNSAVVVYGTVDSVSELKGYEVVTALNSKGEIIFVSTEGIEYITGKITAVDISDGAFTIGDTEYEADDALAATKNGTELTGSLANKLVALKDTTANVWLDDDGVAYRVEARMLDNVGKVIDKKTVSVSVDGTVYMLTFKDGPADVTLAKEVTISRNGLPAGWADLKKGDSCDYAVEGGKIVWIDVWNQVVESAQVTARYDLGSKNKQIVALVNGVSTTYQCTADGFAEIDSVNTYWDLYIGRDGKLYDAVEVTKKALAVHGTIAGLSIETTVVEGKGRTIYKVILSDGSSVSVPLEADDDELVLKNNEELTVGATPSTWFGETFKVGDGISADRVADGSVSEVRLYSVDFAGEVNVDGDTFTIDDGADIELASRAKISLNGETVNLSSLEGKQARVTWDIEDGTATKLEGYEFCESNEYPTAIIGIGESDGDYTFVVADGHGGLGVVEASEDAVVYRDGVAAKLSDIQLGDKVRYSCDGEYLEVTSDEDAPEIKELEVFVDGDELLVVVEFDEEVQTPTIWVAGKKFTGAESTDGKFFEWTLTVEQDEDLDLESDDFYVSGDNIAIAITVKDYAGNVLNATEMVKVKAD